MTREMKDSGIEWIGEIPKEWNLRKLKYLLEERNEKNSPVKTKDILSLSVQRGVFPYSEKVGGGNKAKEDLTAYKLTYPGDIVINSMNILAGAVGLSKYFGAVSPVYYTLFADDENINIDYYYSLFLTKEFQKSLLGLGNGIMMKESDNGKLNTIRMRIPLDKLLSLKLPVPSLEEQNRITKYVNERIILVDKILSDTQQSIMELKSYKQSLITETVTKGLDENVEMKNSGINWIGKIPVNYFIPKLGNITQKIGSGKTPLGGENVYVDKGILFLRSQNIYNEGLNIESPRYINEQTDREMSGTKVFYNDVLLNITGGSIGRSSIYNREEHANVNQHVCIIRSNPMLVLSKWIHFCLISDIGEQSISFYQTGGNREGLNFSDISKIKIPIPRNLEEQKEIVDFLDEKTSKVDSLIKDKEQIIKEYEEYKKSLIYEYVTGKKQV